MTSGGQDTWPLGRIGYSVTHANLVCGLFCPDNLMLKDVPYHDLSLEKKNCKCACTTLEKSKIQPYRKGSLLGFWTVFHLQRFFCPIYQRLKQDGFVAQTVFYQMRRLRAQTVKSFMRKCQNSECTLFYRFFRIKIDPLNLFQLAFVTGKTK